MMSEELKDSGTISTMAVIGLVFGLIGMMGSFVPCIGSLAFSADNNSISKNIMQLDKQKVNPLAAAGKSPQEQQASIKQQEGAREFDVGLDAYKRGLWEMAVARWEKSWGLGIVEALNNVAWVLATCKDANQHNGKRAVELALKATKLMPDKAYYFGTLAAAYARNGQFEEAIKTQVQALSMGDIPGGKERLTLYRKSLPFQEK
jgi:tetratricopeptide (TPR) repeat protein